MHNTDRCCLENPDFSVTAKQKKDVTLSKPGAGLVSRSVSPTLGSRDWTRHSCCPALSALGFGGELVACPVPAVSERTGLPFPQTEGVQERQPKSKQ